MMYIYIYIYIYSNNNNCNNNNNNTNVSLFSLRREKCGVLFVCSAIVLDKHSVRQVASPEYRGK